jgi:DNA polymerase III subunit delta
MLQVFAGEDTFASYNAAREYATKLSQQSNMELLIVDGDELNKVSDLTQPLESMSMFDSGKVLLAKRLLSNPKLASYIEDNLENLKDKPLVIWQDKKLDARTGLSKSLKSHKLVSESSVLSEGEIVNWLKAEAKQAGVELSSDLARRLVEYKGTDRGILFQELQKLISYTQATESRLDQSALDSLIGADLTGDIWKFLDALANGNKAAAISEFEKLTHHSDNIQYLLSMLSRELTILYQVLWAKQEGKSLQALKLHPFVLEKAAKKASRFTLAKLQKLSQALLRLDLAIKQGKLEDITGLTVYLLIW